MKHIRLLLFYFIAPILVFTACSDDDDSVNDAELILSKSEIVMPQAGNTAIFYVKSSVAWQLSGATDWCSVTPTSGDAGETTKVTITTTENNTTDERTAILTISGGGEDETLTVVQSLNLYVDKSLYQVKAEGETVKVLFKNDGTSYEVKSNTSWIAQQNTQRAV